MVEGRLQGQSAQPQGRLDFGGRIGALGRGQMWGTCSLCPFVTRCASVTLGRSLHVSEPHRVLSFSPSSPTLPQLQPPQVPAQDVSLALPWSAPLCPFLPPLVCLQLVSTKHGALISSHPPLSPGPAPRSQGLRLHLCHKHSQNSVLASISP